MKLPALPVPDPGSTLNFERLAASVEPGETTALPTAPRDGQVIDYVADAAAGVVWRLRYRAASASVYRWEFVGGASLLSVSAGTQNETLASGAFAYQDATSSPGLTLPLAGDYTLRFGLQVIHNVAANTLFEARVDTSANVDLSDPIRNGGGWSGDRGTMMQEFRVTGQAAGTATKLRIAGNNTTAAGFTTLDRFLVVVPVRVG